MPLHPDWKDVARDLPDARAVRSRNEKKSVFLGWMEECFCVNCGKPKGMISKEMAAHIFALCDDCVTKYGVPPDAIEVPESIVAAAAAASRG